MNVWQTYRTLTLPAPAKAARATWFDNGFENVVLYDDTLIEKFMASSQIRSDFGTDALKVMRAMPLGVMKADFWRWAILYAEGGIYADIDCVCCVPQSTWTERFNMGLAYIGLENDLHLCNWCMVAPEAKSPVIAAVVEAIIRRVRDEGIDTAYPYMVHRYTGPGIVTEGIAWHFLKRPAHAEEMLADYQMRPTWWQAQGMALTNNHTFSGEFAVNEYGSQFYQDGYASWTSERNTLGNVGIIRL
jgi:mannosyltransferase OCH1-like enzyme